MLENKYSKFLTIILIVAIFAIVVLLAIFGNDIYQKIIKDKAVAEVLNEFNDSINNTQENTNTPANSDVVTPVLNEEVIEENNTSTGGKKVTLKGYNVIGTIEIPKIKLNYPILERTTPDSIELSVAMLYGPGPNKIGNTVIIGHNYRNGSFFGNNDKLSIGDKIYITDTTGTRIEYNIYNIYETTPDDADYFDRDTGGKREISLSTCTNNSKARLVIWASE